jgi:hypothetical protein
MKKKTVGLTAPEPASIRNGAPATWDLVIADMKQRDAVGVAKYGTRLQPGNGRRSLVDAYQEALDEVVYLRNEIEERKAVDERLALLEANLAKKQQCACAYCGHITKRNGMTAKEFDAESRRHILLCEKRPEAQLYATLMYIIVKHHIKAPHVQDPMMETVERAQKWLAGVREKARREGQRAGARVVNAK